jgi:hypothetical protein
MDSNHKPLTPEWLHELIQIWFPDARVTADRVVAHLDARQLWPDEWIKTSLYRSKRDTIRKLIGKITDEHGHRIFHSLKLPDAQGVLHLEFVNEQLLDADGYRAVLDEYYPRISGEMDNVDTLRENCFRRYGVRLPTFEEWREEQRRWADDK